MGFFQRLKEGLKKTSNSIASVFSQTTEIDEDFYDELEETLISADMGFETTERVIDELRDKVEELGIKDASQCKEYVMNSLREQMHVPDNAYCFEDAKTVMLIIGVNGVGKTTSIGKLAAQYKNQGRTVLVAAADTFRAGAIEQLRTWTERAGVDLIAQNEGADPSAVVYDAVKAAKARKTNLTLIDTAGRLHNKKNLMDELAKMRRVINREYPECYVETLIVLDGSTGQNALEQARQFSSVTEINGIILTKLDGTAKGGIAVAIQSELKVPVKYIGVGEKIDDLQKFDPEEYINALFADFDMKSDIEMIAD
ncbi:MAG: signal recognition particle-docking protein FtsY [Eubacterium sp.]|nr:signal recognition particle-docking protein FtsY [Eubacterium sp.]